MSIVDTESRRHTDMSTGWAKLNDTTLHFCL